jgi:hypothetical protein
MSTIGQDFDQFEKKRASQKHWRLHVTKYFALKYKYKKSENRGFSPHQYSMDYNIDQSAFKWWIGYIKLEDRYIFYRSIALTYLENAQQSLTLIEKYKDIDPKLRMPLMRDAIVSYSALFHKNHGRFSAKQQLKKSDFVPESLEQVHKKVCFDRDIVFAHCDIAEKKPEVTSIGITMRGQGFYWEDYLRLLPNFKKLLSVVTTQLKDYIQKESMESPKCYFKDYADPPSKAMYDPGIPLDD